MLEILKFIFSSFWVWLGTYLLVVSVACVARGMGLLNVGRNLVNVGSKKKDE